MSRFEKGHKPWNGNQVELICSCSNSFKVSPFYAKTRKHCSKSCYAKSAIGKKATNGQRAKRPRTEKQREIAMLKMRTFYELHPEARSRASIKTVQSYLEKKRIAKQGKFYSQKNGALVYYRSSYELVAMNFFEAIDSIEKYDYEPFSIQYKWEDGSLHRTIPDFVLYFKDGSKQILEIKPLFKIEKNIQHTNVKIAAQKDFADKNGYSYAVWTEKELNIK